VVRGNGEIAMRNDTLLKLSSIVFAALSSLPLIWWTRGPVGETPLAILLLCAMLAGALGYWLYGKWFRWYIERH
jgi:hypothetical protein